MSFYSMYRIFKDIFKTIFGYKFWRKLLICIIIGVILFFVLHNYGYCATPEDINSYNQIEKIGTYQGIVLSNASGQGVFRENANYVVEIYRLSNASTYVMGGNVYTNSRDFRIGVGDVLPQVGQTCNYLAYQNVTAGGSFDYTFYNDTYTYLYLSYEKNTFETWVYEQVYSTYIKPLVTKTHSYITGFNNVSTDTSQTFYITSFQINKGFNYKVSGLSSSVNAYYTSELNQLMSTSAVVNFETKTIYLPSTGYYTESTDGGYVTSSTATQYYNETTSGSISFGSGQASVSSTPHSSAINYNVLPFYDTLTNNEEFTANYTGWLTFVADSDLSSSLEIWTDYNFYDHDTIYIDNRIQNVNSSVQQGTSEINQSVQDMSNTISDNLTNTNYNQSDVNFNTSSVDNVSSSATDGIFTTIFNNFNNAISGGVSELVIPLPHNSGSITISSDIVSSHLGNLTLLVNAFWMYLFGIYAFRFVNNLIHSIKNGDILNGFNSSNEVITNTMV